jgi:hypothetical protein
MASVTCNVQNLMPMLSKLYKFECARDCRRSWHCKTPCNIIQKTIPAVDKGRLHHAEMYDEHKHDKRALDLAEHNDDTALHLPPEMFAGIKNDRLLIILAGLNAGMTVARIAVQLDVTVRRINQILALAKGQ